MWYSDVISALNKMAGLTDTRAAQIHGNYIFHRATSPALCSPELPQKFYSCDSWALKVILAPRPGLEPGTCGLTVRRSTD